MLVLVLASGTLRTRSPIWQVREEDDEKSLAWTMELIAKEQARCLPPLPLTSFITGAQPSAERTARPFRATSAADYPPPPPPAQLYTGSTSSPSSTHLMSPEMADWVRANLPIQYPADGAGARAAEWAGKAADGRAFQKEGSHGGPAAS